MLLKKSQVAAEIGREQKAQSLTDRSVSRDAVDFRGFGSSQDNPTHQWIPSTAQAHRPRRTSTTSHPVHTSAPHSISRTRHKADEPKCGPDKAENYAELPAHKACKPLIFEWTDNSLQLSLILVLVSMPLSRIVMGVDIRGIDCSPVALLYGSLAFSSNVFQRELHPSAVIARQPSIVGWPNTGSRSSCCQLVCAIVCLVTVAVTSLLIVLDHIPIRTSTHSMSDPTRRAFASIA
jgi:hypothetical protein